ncbi:MAG: MarC family protein [Arenicellales bacterium]
MDSTTTLIGLAMAALAGYFAIMNPISNTATFIGITSGDDRATKKAVAAKSLLLAFAIIALVSVAGNLIFKMFGITLASLRITGGIVVFVIGYNMLQGSGAAAHTPGKGDIASSKEAQLSVAVSPLAVPILAGPGTIATAMSFASEGWVHIAVSLAAFALICFVTYLCFVQSDKLVAYLGQNGLNVMTRLMGLIVASIGVGMFLTGIGYTPGN